MLEPITDHDVPRVVAMMNRAYRGSGASAGWSTEVEYIAGDRTTESLLRSELKAKPEALFLKWENPQTGALEGCVWLEPVSADVWYLGSLTVDPTQQKSGLGKTILAAAETWLLQRGARCVRMTVVNLREPLIAWYGRRGYAPTGETLPFPYDDARFGTPLRDGLVFVVLAKDLAGSGRSN
jgi:GNAT superfamily N-acetyltransferase